MADSALQDGDVIQLHGLKGAAQFNDQFGYVETAELNAKGRMVVCVGGDLKSLKPANLAKVEIPHRVGDLVKIKNLDEGEGFGHVQGVSAKSGALIVSTSYSERKETEVADIETDLPRDQCFGSGDTVSLQNLSKAEMNGKKGRIIGFAKNRRYIVLMEAPISKPYKLTPDKLKLESRGWNTGAINISNPGELSYLIKNTSSVLVDFWSPSCPPCVKLKPMLKEWLHAPSNKNVAVAFVNVQDHPEFGQMYSMEGIPDIRGFFFGNQHKKVVGLHPNQPGIRINALLKELSEKERKGS